MGYYSKTQTAFDEEGNNVVVMELCSHLLLVFDLNEKKNEPSLPKPFLTVSANACDNKTFLIIARKQLSSIHMLVYQKQFSLT